MLALLGTLRDIVPAWKATRNQQSRVKFFDRNVFLQATGIIIEPAISQSPVSLDFRSPDEFLTVQEFVAEALKTDLLAVQGTHGKSKLLFKVND